MKVLKSAYLIFTVMQEVSLLDARSSKLSLSHMSMSMLRIIRRSRVSSLKVLSLDMDFDSL